MIDLGHHGENVRDGLFREEMMPGLTWEKYIYRVVPLANGTADQLIQCASVCFYDGQPCNLFVQLSSNCYLGAEYVNTNIVSGMSNQTVHIRDSKHICLCVIEALNDIK